MGQKASDAAEALQRGTKLQETESCRRKYSRSPGVQALVLSDQVFVLWRIKTGSTVKCGRA